MTPNATRAARAALLRITEPQHNRDRLAPVGPYRQQRAQRGIARVDHITSRSRGKDAPMTTAPATLATAPGPHPQPHPRRHWAEASVAVTANVAATVAAARI